jgi:hypothetical protein
MISFWISVVLPEIHAFWPNERWYHSRDRLGARGGAGQLGV